MTVRTNPIPTADRATRARCGFTLIELMLGMVVTTLVMAAIGGVMTAVARGWSQSEDTQATSNITSQTHLRLQRILKAAKQLGACRPGALDGTAAQSAALMIWKADANADGKVQFSELGLIAYEPGATADSSEIRYYEVAYPSTWTLAQKQTADTPALANDEIYKDSDITTFRTMANVRSTVLARSIAGTEFHRADGATVVRPTFEYLLNFQKGSTTELEYGTVAVRTPTTLPASQGGT
jgi:type II secretory pathway pseudopilin PulG